MSYSQPTAVPGQSTSGIIDGFGRSSSSDGTLGKPDFSPLEYAYAPALEPTSGHAQWSIGTAPAGSSTVWGAFKGNPDGLAALRDTGGNDASILLRLVADNSAGSLITPQYGKGLTAAQIWNKQDFVLPVRAWGIGVDSYLGFLKGTQSVRFFRALSTAVGPWDAEPCDQPAVSLSGKVNLWDGNPHDIILTQVDFSVMALIDYKVPVLFPNPGVWHYVNGVPTGSRNSLATTSGLSYMGFDTRSTRAALTSWGALPQPSVDCFLWRPSFGPQDPASSTTYTPTTMDSAQSWTISGTATGSKDGVLLASASSMWCTPFRTSGWISTRYGAVASAGGLIFRRLDANNYLILTQGGLLRAVVGGVATTLYTLGSSIATDSEVVVRYNASKAAISINNGATVFGDMASLTTGVDISGQVPTGTGVGFLSPSGSTSQFRYLYHQPDFTVPVLPTT